MARPLTQSDLIFPSQSLSISTTLQSLKRSALSIHNRFASIQSDAEFVSLVSDAYGLPLVANERCGSWYIPPEKKAESVYFKSTDGHMNEWSFSLRRLNFQVLDVVDRYGGCIMVDSTRRGKSMPDAFSKTVPIWCCVMNRALFPHGGLPKLHTPSQSVSESEHAQIEKGIDGFLRQFLDVCKPNIEELRSKVRKPLRPIWVTHESTVPEDRPTWPEYHPIVLCTASRRVYGAEGSDGGYIQGAADDHEAWAHGLTPAMFWRNREQLLNTNEDELPSFIAHLMKEECGPDAAPIRVSRTPNLYISTIRNLDISSFDAVISCTLEPLTAAHLEDQKTKKYLHLRCQEGKLGSRDLRTQLPYLTTFISSLNPTVKNILVCCTTGKDLSVGVALAILCLYADENGSISTAQGDRKINKTFIKQRLAWLTTTHPTLNPSRATLQSINAFLMPDPKAAAKQDMSVAAQIPPSQLLLVSPNSDTTASDHMPHTTSNEAIKFSREPRSLHAVLFHNLHNASKPWTFTRELRSTLRTHPSGTVTGTATFTPYTQPTSSATTRSARLLYNETGEFITTTNLRFTTRRRYIYLLQGSVALDENLHIAVHFADNDDGKEAMGGLFVEMDELNCEDKDGVWQTKNREQHLCAEDLYTASWRFGRAMVIAEEEEGNEKERWWEVRYDVKGPKKDYISTTRYTLS